MLHVGLHLAVKVLVCDVRYAGSNPVGQPISSPSSNGKTPGSESGHAGSIPAGGTLGLAGYANPAV